MAIMTEKEKTLYTASPVQADTLCSLFPSIENKLSQYAVFPGFCDVHVHFREPGFSYKETITTGSMAAAHGGYTAVCSMPNLAPVPHSIDTLKQQLDLIKQNNTLHIYPYGAITMDRKGCSLSRMEELAPYVAAFSDDGSGVQNRGMMRQAMLKAKALHKIIAAHCEDNSLLNGGYIHAGAYAAQRGHRGISSASEYLQLQRDLELVEETGCDYHVCHISTKESVELIRQAKKKGLPVTCETAPHYLTLWDECLREDGSFKMNPPLRSKSDRDALLEGIFDGTVDMIATDHAPHSRQEKAKGLVDSAFGIVGLETAFPVLYTRLVIPGILSLTRLIELMCIAPRKRFSIPLSDDYSVWDLDKQTVITEEFLLSKGKSTPYLGETVFGKCLATVVNGKVIYHM